MDEFMQSYRRKQGLPVHPSGKQGVSGSSDALAGRDGGSDVEPRCLNHGPKSAMTVQASCQASESDSEALSQVSSGEPTSPADSIDSLWADAHMKFHFPESDSEADRLFIESGNKLIAAHRAKKKRFSWAGLLALLAVAAGVMWLVYSAVEGW